ncbi:MAG TPA: GNAT family N-acetyltransferase [Candidatus Limnocylindrales bacterium]|nr:GNAT family N-acetyltransferase [Candidatus Limnocylindrales bacterium]
MSPTRAAPPRDAIRVVPATADRWRDVALLLDGDAAERGCWCQSWRGQDPIAKATGETRPETLRRQLESDVPPPGFVAYLGDEPAGWIGVGLRGRTPRLDGSRTIPAIDDRPVWAIGCFRIRVGYRRKGVAGALLEAVVDAARAAGAPGVEAYPIDPDGRRVDVAFAFVGIASMFDRAGFRRVVETNAHSAGLPRLLVRLDL